MPSSPNAATDPDTADPDTAGPDTTGSSAPPAVSAPVAVPVRSQPTHRPGLVLGVIVACQMMVGLDATVVNVALPHIQSALGFTPAGLAWVFNAYTLAYGGLLLLGGRAGDLFGRRRLFLAGVLVFTGSSLLAGLAPAAGWLLAARALQGVGGALATPNVLALIMVNFPEGGARTRALAVFSAATSASISAGMVIGGVLTTWGSWRWVFFVNVPFGVLVAALTPRLVRETETHRGRLDPAGAVASVAGTGLIVFGFLHAATAGFGSPVSVASLAGGVAGLVALVLVERRAEQPVVPLGLLAKRSRAAAYSAFFLITCGMFGVFFYVGQYFQDVQGYSALRAGMAFLPMTLAMFALIRTVPRLLPRVGAPRMMTTGLTMCLAGMLWLSRLPTGHDYASSVLGPLLLIGVGMGLASVPLSVTILSGVQPREAGAASGLLQAMQWTGSAVGLSILVAVGSAASRREAARPGAGAAQDFVHGASAAFSLGAVFVVGALACAAATVHRRGAGRGRGVDDGGSGEGIGRGGSGSADGSGGADGSGSADGSAVVRPDRTVAGGAARRVSFRSAGTSPGTSPTPGR